LASGPEKKGAPSLINHAGILRDVAKACRGVMETVVKVNEGKGAQPLLRFEPTAVNEKVFFYA